MVECRRFPVGNGVAIFTDCALAAKMLIVLLVTTKASGRRLFELTGGGMAFFADNGCMLPIKLETGQSMIKLGIFPVLLTVTVLTGSPKVFPVRIIFEMALSAYCRRCLEITQQVCPAMAFGTG